MTGSNSSKLAALLHFRLCNQSDISGIYFSDIVSKIITLYSGKIINNSFGVFSAITTAARCSIDIQKSIRRWNLYQPPEDNLTVGIINDVGEVDGDGKIYSASVQDLTNQFLLAESGGIISTQIVYSSIRSESDIFTRDIGRVKIPNMPEPERYYKIYVDEIDWKLESSTELKKSIINRNIDLVDFDQNRDGQGSEEQSITRKLSNDSTALRFFNQGCEQLKYAQTVKDFKVVISILENALQRDNKFLEAKCELAFTYLKLDNLDRGFQLLQECKCMARSENNLFGTAITSQYMGIFLEYLNNIKGAIHYFRQSHQIFTKLKEDVSEIDDILKNLEKTTSEQLNVTELISKIIPAQIEIHDEEKTILATMFTEFSDYGKKENNVELLKIHDAEMDKLIPNGSGRIIKHITEKILAVFDTPEDAVRCANAIHNYWKNYENGNIRIRVGIHLGEVSLKGEDVFGDSINMAARIEPVALPGTTAVSQIIHHAIHQMPGVTSRESKAVILKNIKDPERIYFVYDNLPPLLDCTDEELHSQMLKQNVQFFSSDTHIGYEESLAVLYLKNKGKPEDEYISFGLTEDLLKSLQLANLIFLPSSTDTKKFKDSKESISIIGEKLKVNHLFTGSVEKIDGKFILDVQLVNSGNEKIIWSEKYTELLSNQESVIHDLTIIILEQLKISVPEHIKLKKVKQLTANPEAYEEYLKGYFLFETGNSNAELENGKQHLRDAFDADLEFVEARYIYAMIEQKQGNNESALDSLKIASEIAEKNQNDAGIACVENGFGNIYMNTGKFEEAINSFENALKMRIKLSDLHEEAKISNNLGQCYSNTGQTEKAERRHIRALEINKEVGDDNGVGITYLNLVLLYNSCLKYDKAITAGNDSLEYFSKGENEFAKERLLHNLGQSFILTGQYSNGRKTLGECIELAEKFKDEIIIGMSEYFLGLIRLDEGKYGIANSHFNVAKEYFNRTKYLPGKILLPLEIGLNDFYRGKYESSRKKIEKTAKLAANLNELPYVNMANSASLMVSSYLNETTIEDIDAEANKFNTANHFVPMRAAWYLSQAYQNQNCTKKSEKFKRISRNILENISNLIVEPSVRSKFLENVNLHKLINSDILTEPARNTHFTYCYHCGNQNLNGDTNCGNCKTSLEIEAAMA